VVACLPLDPRLAGSNPADDGTFKAIKIRSTTPFGGEVKSSVPCRKILRHVNELCKYERDTSWPKFSISFVMFSCFATI
jgi:hypothetical protein